MDDETYDMEILKELGWDYYDEEKWGAPDDADPDMLEELKEEYAELKKKKEEEKAEEEGKKKFPWNGLLKR